MTGFTIHACGGGGGAHNWAVTFPASPETVAPIARFKYRNGRRRGLSAYDARNVVIGQLAAVFGCEVSR